jgi:hypothetical protein
MNFVEPIRDRKKIAQIKNRLRGQRRFRDLLLFTMGINSALCISDLLQLQIGHFIGESGRPKRRFWIQEQKRGKRHEVYINNSIREALEEYLAAYPGVANNPENSVFFNIKTNAYSKPIKRGQAWTLMLISAYQGNQWHQPFLKAYERHAGEQLEHLEWQPAPGDSTALPFRSLQAPNKWACVLVQETMQNQIEPTRAVYDRLQQLTGIRLPLVEDWLD